MYAHPLHAAEPPPRSAAPKSGSRRPGTPTPLSYRALLGNDAWLRLPPSTRARFTQHTGRYTGTLSLRASGWGRWIARLCYLIGSPLPPHCATPVPAAVRVDTDPATGGSRWTRSYELPDHSVEIESVKAIDRDGGLVERLPAGLRMRLDVCARGDSLHFVSTGYYFELPGLRWRGGQRCAWRVPLPSWGLPGRTHVVHEDLGRGLFRFTMTIRHRFLGELFRHDGVFRTTGD
jgi:hypothetical protein